MPDYTGVQSAEAGLSPMAQVGVIIMVAFAFVIGLFVLIAIIKAFMYICKPNEILVFSGRKRKLEDGTVVGFRVVFGGRAFRVPILERVDRMDMTVIPIDIAVHNAFSKGGIPLHVQCIANVKVHSDPLYVGNAIERFMGKGLGEIQLVAKQTLEGTVRGVVAQLTPEEVNEDRLKFAETLVHNAHDDFCKLGIALDTLKIQHVSDQVQYLESIGRRRIAEVVRDGEIAESNAQREAEQAAAAANQRGVVATETARTVIARAENELRRIKAELDGKARSEEEQVEPAAAAARAQAEQELQSLRAELEKLRLEADEVIPSEADKVAKQAIAKGIAAPRAEQGAAQAQVLEMMTKVWAEAGPDARDIFLMQQIESVMRTVTEAIGKVDVGEVTLIDTGDGRALPQFLASFPASVSAVLEALKTSAGVDIPRMLADRAGK
jgi:flotillin